MIAYHSIFGAYGFWLPNDPRGSGSDYIAVWELYRYGGATKLASREASVAARPHDRALRLKTKEAIHFPPVQFTAEQAAAVVEGFATGCEESGYRVHACAVLRDHVHLVIGSHPRNIRQLVSHVKSRATRQLKESGLWFDHDRPVWGEHGWNVFLDDLPQVQRAIAYVEANPVKEGLPAQSWPVVTPFEVQAVVARAVVEVKRATLGGAALRSQQTRQRRLR